MTNRPHENEIDMERRHIREAEACIARQEEVVVRLDLMGAEELAQKAREPLVRFHQFIAVARERLAVLEKARGNDVPESQQGAGGSTAA